MILLKCTGSFRFLLARFKLAFLFLSVTSGLRLVANTLLDRRHSLTASLDWFMKGCLDWLDDWLLGFFVLVREHLFVLTCLWPTLIYKITVKSCKIHVQHFIYYVCLICHGLAREVTSPDNETSCQSCVQLSLSLWKRGTNSWAGKSRQKSSKTKWHVFHSGMLKEFIFTVIQILESRKE